MTLPSAVNDLSVFVDDHAAHCVVTLHRDATCIERGLDDLVDQYAFGYGREDLSWCQQLCCRWRLASFRLFAGTPIFLAKFFNGVGVVERACLQSGLVFRSFGVLLLFKTVSVNDLSKRWPSAGQAWRRVKRHVLRLP